MLEELKTYTSDLWHTLLSQSRSQCPFFGLQQVCFAIFLGCNFYSFFIPLSFFETYMLSVSCVPSTSSSRAISGERDRESVQSLWVAEISRHQCYRFNHSQTQTKERQPGGKQTIRPNMFDNETPALRFHSSHFEVQMTLTDKQACSGFALFIYLDFFRYGLRKRGLMFWGDKMLEGWVVDFAFSSYCCV